jgi:glycosyltransferase involved in cell wall biosynthesis
MSLNSLKISIITINHNSLKDLKLTVSNIVGQSHSNYEHIVIDGGSTDGSKEFLELNKRQFSYWVSEPDNGIYHAMNKGITKAKGDYIFFLNSGDDFVNRNSLKKISQNLTGEDIIYFNINQIDEKNHIKVKKVPGELTFDYLHQDLPPHQSTFFNRQLFEKLGGFDERLKIVADWKFLILALLKYNASYKHVDEIHTNFCLGGISSNEESENIMRKERNVVLQEEFPILLNDLNYKNKLERIIRNLRKSRKIRLLVRLGLLDRF